MFAQILGKVWNALTDEEKQPYVELAQKDRERYKKETQNFENVKFQNNKCKPKKVKDPSKPKAITRPYLFFFVEFLKGRREQNLKGSGAAELSKECGQLW